MLNVELKEKNQWPDTGDSFSYKLAALLHLGFRHLWNAERPKIENKPSIRSCFPL